MRAKLGTAQAITATAHKIARILYHVLSTKEPYTETIFHLYDEQAHQRAEIRLRKQAARLGFQLVTIPATGESQLVPQEPTSGPRHQGSSHEPFLSPIPLAK
jgi:transposase